MKRTISTLMMAAAALLVSSAFLPSTVDAKKPTPDLNVDCDAGESIQSALDAAKHYLPVTVTVTGTCEEFVWIRRDDVTIDGNNDATVIGTIAVDGGRRITVRNLTVTGAVDTGVQVANGNVDLVGLNVINNYRHGITSIRESWVGVHDSFVSGSLFGAFVQDSTLEVFNSEFTNNFWVGIQMDTGANALVSDASIHHNGQGINNALHSIAEIESGTEITSNGYGVYLAEDSGLRIDGPGVIITGNSISDLFCADSESSYRTRDNPLDGNISCTDFNQVSPAP